MEYLTSSFSRLCFGPKEEPISLVIKKGSNMYEFNGKDCHKLYYSLLQQAHYVNVYNTYPTKIILYTNKNKTNFFTTYKRLIV